MRPRLGTDRRPFGGGDFSGGAGAHPHVWVDTVVTALLDHGKITALREEWWFDEDFTVMALSEVRKTKGMAAAMPKPLSGGEILQLKQKAFSNLANYAYFNHVWAAGKPVAVAKEVSSFDARMDGAKLVYTFTLPLAKPVEAKALRIGIWDETYYVDVGPAKASRRASKATARRPAGRGSLTTRSI